MISSLLLDNFRNYKKCNFEFSKKITIILGPNGSGKTNILEAIFLLSLGKSPRAGMENELVRLDSEYARVVGKLDNGDKLEVVLQRKPNTNRIQKTFKINGAQKVSTKFTGNFKAVLFAPEDIRLVAGSPSRRRDYLDRVLLQIYPEYRRCLLKYNKVLRQRNKLLDQIQGQFLHHIHQSQLAIWNGQLLESGIKIQDYRGRFFRYAKDELHKISRDLYEDGFELELEYKKNLLSENRLDSFKEKDLARGITQIGPHRDDYEFIMKNKSGRFVLKGYGSRGQQRTGVLCMKILEMDYIEKISSERPILLLDDIFSELDKKYRKAIQSITQNQQTIITTADENSVPDDIRSLSNDIKLGKTRFTHL